MSRGKKNRYFTIYKFPISSSLRCSTWKEKSNPSCAQKAYSRWPPYHLSQNRPEQSTLPPWSDSFPLPHRQFQAAISGRIPGLLVLLEFLPAAHRMIKGYRCVLKDVTTTVHKPVLWRARWAECWSQPAGSCPRGCGSRSVSISSSQHPEQPEWMEHTGGTGGMNYS